MASASTNQLPGGDGRTRSGREEATAFVTGAVDRFADVTAQWLKDSARAFATCVEHVQQPGFTTDQLVKDVAGMWARNVEYLGRLVQIGVPHRPAAPGPGPQGPPPGDQQPPPEGPEDQQS